MRHMLAGKNLAMMMPKQHKNEFGVLATNFISAHKSVAAYDINYHFPLYVYLTAEDRRSNLKRELVERLTGAHGREPSPEDIFHYIYGILYAPKYRQKYAESLRREFPRVPFTADRELFAKLTLLGSRLTELHLFTSPELDRPTSRFDGQGNLIVARTKAQGLRYDPQTRRMYINKTQYFGPLTADVYEYRIGGYQVCDKWLKDRKERRLELEEIQTYCRIVTAIGHTIGIQEQLDDLYPEVEKDLVSIPAE